jgi:hypothetical protein
VTAATADKEVVDKRIVEEATVTRVVEEAAVKRVVEEAMEKEVTDKEAADRWTTDEPTVKGAVVGAAEDSLAPG